MHPHSDDEIRLTIADLDGARVARVATSNAAAALADRVIAIVSTLEDRNREPGGILDELVQARRVMNAAFDRAIALARLQGLTWEAIADKLSVPVDWLILSYKKYDLTYLADDPQGVWDFFRPTCVAPVHDSCSDDPAEAARKLDIWAARHHDTREAVPPQPQPVTAGLITPAA